MKVVVRRTGLTADLIRVWERRYAAVTPGRTQTGRRLYSDDEIVRLQMLADATRAGHGIGQVARLTEGELRGLLAQEQGNGQGRRAVAQARAAGEPDYVAESLAAVRDLAVERLEGLLGQAAMTLGPSGVLEDVVAPLISQIGELWRNGVLGVVQEHAATAVLRTFLAGRIRSPFRTLPPDLPRVLVATPPGQLHELGALLVCATAGAEGWQATYLGPCLPAEEMATAALTCNAQAVALSLVYPEDDPRVETELRRLRRLLPPPTALLVGGRAAPGYRALLESLQAITPRDLAGLRSTLGALRRQIPSESARGYRRAGLCASDPARFGS